MTPEKELELELKRIKWEMKMGLKLGYPGC
jgi:hypothetical protein